MWTWLTGLPAGAATFVGSLTGSLVGLIAILIGALFNAYLNRRRDDALRNADRRSIAAALKAELTGLNGIVHKNASSLDTATKDFYVPDPSLYVRVMPATIQKIGLLDVDTIRSIIAAYSLVDQYSENLMRAGGHIYTQMPEHRRVFQMPKEAAKSVADLNRQLSDYLADAIKRLDAIH